MYRYTHSVRRLGLLAVACLGLAAAAGAHAQDFPQHPITVIVPVAAGGGTDAVARAVSAAMSEALGQPVIVDNRPGASGMIAANLVARAAPTGYTLFMTTSSFVIQTLRRSTAQQAGLENFVPIGLAATAPMALNVSANLPVKTAAEFVEYARSHPGQLNYATFGNGTTPHLVTEQMDARLGLQMVNVPYQGAALAVLALARGDVQVFTDILATSLPLAKEGRTRMLALMSPRRSPNAPNVPTFTELGYPEILAEVLIGVSAPARTPPAVLERLRSAFAASLAKPEVVERIRAQQLDPATPGADFAGLLVQERDKWKKLVERLDLKLD